MTPKSKHPRTVNDCEKGWQIQTPKGDVFSIDQDPSEFPEEEYINVTNVNSGEKTNVHRSCLVTGYSKGENNDT